MFQSFTAEVKSDVIYPYCLVLVGSRNGLERDFTIDLK